MKKLIKLSASLKLAVIIIILIAVITAVGTFVESEYDAYAAKKWVYDTWMMYTVMGLLAFNLIGVMVDRWPWKRRHVAFVLAHIGILVILFGAVLTMQFGLDGSMRVGIGQENNLVQVAQTDLVVYSSFDGDRYSKTFEGEVDFFLHPPSEKNPVVIPTLDGDIRIVDYMRYAIPKKKVVAADNERAGAGVRFQVQNANVNVIEWLVQRKSDQIATHDFGPAKVHLGPAPKEGQGRNEVYLEKKGAGLRYTVFHKSSPRPFKTGDVAEGGVFEPGWMGIQFRVLRYLPYAIEDWDLVPLTRPTPLTTAAVKVIFGEKTQWLLMNDMLKLFTQKSVYLLSYANRRIDLGFPMKLQKFQIDRYEGTTRAKEYMSIVDVPGNEGHPISMNQPLIWKGLRIYQASFQEENGQPVASVFSVNHDPGRVWKYLGSLIMTLGIIFLFYFKHEAPL